MSRLKTAVENSEKGLSKTKEILKESQKEFKRLHDETSKLKHKFAVSEELTSKYMKLAKENQYKYELLQRHYKNLERKNEAATIIQREYRAYRMRVMNKMKEDRVAELRKAKDALGNLAAKHAEMAEKRNSNLAFAGQTLLGEGLEVLQETVEGLLTTFLLPSKDLKALQRYRLQHDEQKCPRPVSKNNSSKLTVVSRDKTEETTDHSDMIPSSHYPSSWMGRTRMAGQGYIQPK